MNIKLYLSAFILLILSSTTFAQGEHVGGGNLTEGDMKYFITKLDRYLQSEDGKIAFPELDKYDETHKDGTIHLIAQSLNPTLKDGEVTDNLGNPRDCVSYSKPIRYFKCNSNTLPDNTLEHQPSFYRLVFHEILVQAGLEKPLSKEVPSEYPIASRLDVHLETYEEWVPGKSLSENDVSKLKKTDHMKLPELEMFLNHAENAKKIIVGDGSNYFSMIALAFNLEKGTKNYRSIITELLKKNGFDNSSYSINQYEPQEDFEICKAALSTSLAINWDTFSKNKDLIDLSAQMQLDLSNAAHGTNVIAFAGRTDGPTSYQGEYFVVIDIGHRQLLLILTEPTE